MISSREILYPNAVDITQRERIEQQYSTVQYLHETAGIICLCLTQNNTGDTKSDQCVRWKNWETYCRYVPGHPPTTHWPKHLRAFLITVTRAIIHLNHLDPHHPEVESAQWHRDC